MRKKFLGAILSIFLAVCAFAQDWEKAMDPSPGFSSVNEAANMAGRIVKAAGLKANFRIAEANVPNALAVLHQGKRFILYNPRFISKLSVVTGTEWSAISVLAHEIGHHLYKNPRSRTERAMATELEADEFSGYVLRKMGASEAEAAAAINLLASERASRTHPGRADRVSSISRGWQKAEVELGGAALAKAEPKIREEETNKAPQTMHAGNIVAAIRFNADPSNEYYVTRRMNVVKMNEGEIQVIARLARSTNSNYPYIIYDEDDTRIYVKSTGDIVTSRGSVVGRMRTRT